LSVLNDLWHFLLAEKTAVPVLGQQGLLIWMLEGERGILK
jgi:hypothetical protein